MHDPVLGRGIYLARGSDRWLTFVVICIYAVTANHTWQVLVSCFLTRHVTQVEREREKKKNPPPPESCRSKVSSLSQSPQVLAEPCQTCCCCPKWDAVLGAVGRALILSSLVNSRFDAHLLDVWRSVFLMMLLLFCHGSHYGKRLTETRLFYSRALACLCRSTRGLPLNYSLCSLFFFFYKCGVCFSRKSWIQVGGFDNLVRTPCFFSPLNAKNFCCRLA